VIQAPRGNGTASNPTQQGAKKRSRSTCAFASLSAAPSSTWSSSGLDLSRQADRNEDLIIRFKLGKRGRVEDSSCDVVESTANESSEKKSEQINYG
jgi:hypothetical protein